MSATKIEHWTIAIPEINERIDMLNLYQSITMDYVNFDEISENNYVLNFTNSNAQIKGNDLFRLDGSNLIFLNAGYYGIRYQIVSSVSESNEIFFIDLIDSNNTTIAKKSFSKLSLADVDCVFSDTIYFKLESNLIAKICVRINEYDTLEFKSMKIDCVKLK